jgi:hypothetical protein
MNKHVPFIWRVNYRNDPRAPEAAPEIVHEKPAKFSEECEVTKMTMTRFHVMAIAAGLLLAISGASSAAARQSRHPLSAHAQAAVKENRGVVTYPSRVPAFDPGGTSAYPFGPGINFPYADRPYGDPDHW